MSQKTFRLCTVLLTAAAAGLLPLHLCAFQFIADTPTQTSYLLTGFMSKPPFLDAALLVCSVLLLRQIHRVPQASKTGLVLAADVILLSATLAAHLLWSVPAIMFGL